MSSLTPDCIVVLGPTACGKTRLAVELARRLKGEIVSADSRQVYRGLDIGTGKDLAEYGSGEGSVPLHLADVADLPGEYHLFRYQREARAALKEIRARGRRPIVCGGTGLYLECLLLDYDLAEAPRDPEFRERARRMDLARLRELYLELNPEPHNVTDLEDRERILRAIEVARATRGAGVARASPGDAVPGDTSGDRRAGAAGSPCPVIGIRPQLETIRRRIGERLRARMEQGLVEEAQGLLERGIPAERLLRLGLEYRWLTRYLGGEIDREELQRGLERAIYRFARRQLSWFRRMERRGLKIHWLECGGEKALSEALKALD